MLAIEEGKRYLGIMPAVAEDAMGLKLVSFYPIEKEGRLLTRGRRCQILRIVLNIITGDS